MEVAATTRTRLATGGLRLDPAGIAAWAIPFLVILYLGLSNGGYDLVQRSEVGIAIWWLLGIGALTGAFTAPPSARLARVCFGVLTALAVWTAVALTWTDSSERTMIELSRVIVFVGIFGLAATAQAATRWRAVLGGVTAALGLIVVLAALSRMHPDLFPAQTSADFFPGVGLEARLTYPLNYSGGLAALAAMSLPLLLRASAEARFIGLQALAGALLPIAMLTIWLTGSSLTVPLIAVALVGYLLLAPDRLPKLLTSLVAAAGSAILIAAVADRPALDQGLGNSAAISQGDELFAFALVVAAGVGLLQVAIGLAVRHGNRPAALAIGRRQAVRLSLAAAAVALVAFLLSPGPGAISDGWDSFKGSSTVEQGDTSRTAQILDLSSRGRYRFWTSAVDAFETAPLQGIGAGTFEFWWAENGDSTEFVRDAHSLYLEMLAELGLPGMILVVGLILTVLAGAVARLARSGEERRGAIAAAASAVAVFAVAAGFDWMWELTVLPVIFLVLAAIALTASDRKIPAEDSPRSGLPLRAGALGLAVVALVIVAIPLGTAAAVRESQDAAGAGRIDQSLAAAGDAAALQPYAATPQLQRALVLEGAGRFSAAAAAARAASASEPRNWRTSLILARIEAEAGNARQAVAAYRDARRLNPRSGIFAR